MEITYLEIDLLFTSVAFPSFYPEGSFKQSDDGCTQHSQLFGTYPSLYFIFPAHKKYQQ